MKLTKTDIDKRGYEGDGRSRDVRWDDQTIGFGVRIFPSGRKSYVLMYRYHGTKRLMTIGKVEVMSLDAARKKAKKLGVAVSDGVDPMQLKREELHGNTVSNLCEYYLEQYAKKKKMSWKEDQRRIERLAELGAVAVKRIGLQGQFPRQHVGRLAVFDGCLVRHVDGLRDGARDERLCRGHHADVAVDRKSVV